MIPNIHHKMRQYKFPDSEIMTPRYNKLNLPKNVHKNVSDLATIINKH